MSTYFTEIIVAVHGIGVQKRSETIRSVATRLAGSKTLLAQGHPHLIARQPLGYFGTDLPNHAAIRLVDDVEVLERMKLASIGFSEVFWSDIPKKVISDERTLEETKAWAHTVASRAEALCRRARERFSVDDIVNLPSLADKLTNHLNDTGRVLLQHLDVRGNEVLRAYKTGEVTDLQLKAALVKGLNKVIAGELIYKPDVFQSIALRSETEQLLVAPRMGDDLIRLNRMLLEDAFSHELTRQKPNRIVPPDFSLAREVLDEMVETIYVLENLVFLAEKVGVFEFDLADLLEKYLGDVQLVTEFGNRRVDVINRFSDAMLSIYEQNHKLNPDFKIHIVAHSEGTVIALLGLLHAMSKQKLLPSNPETGADSKTEDLKDFPEWLKHIRGFMTIGSPIDKHLLLWPRLWNGLEPKKANDLFRDHKIQWRNYYDYGDPVGFRLESARLWLEQVDCGAFEFCGCSKCHHDIGFARYLFPGEAHVEYWNDDEVFEHFIRDVVIPENPRPEPPGNRDGREWLSPLLPYMMSFLILGIGVFVLYKALLSFTYPGFDPLQKYIRFKELGIVTNVDYAKSFSSMCGTVLGITCLIAGATLLSRFSRLASGAYWRISGFAAFILGCECYCAFVNLNVRTKIGGALPVVGTSAPTLAVLVLSGLGGWCGYLVGAQPNVTGEKRRKWFQRGTHPLMICGILIVATIVFLEMTSWVTPPYLRRLAEPPTLLSTQQIELIREARLNYVEATNVIGTFGTNWVTVLTDVRHVLVSHPSEWPVLLASVAFFYLWWLAILIFDLSFVWHRYIRKSIANQRLNDWNPYGFRRRQDGSDERCLKKNSDAK